MIWILFQNIEFKLVNIKEERNTLLINKFYYFKSAGYEDTDQRFGGNRVTPALLQSTLFHRKAFLPARQKSRYLLRMVRFVDGSAELPANSRLRKGVYSLQCWRALYAVGCQARSFDRSRTRSSGRRFSQSGRHLPIYSWELHKCTEYGFRPGYARDAGAVDACKLS